LGAGPILTLVTGEHNGAAWSIELDPTDPTRAIIEVLT
jgi:hypothetical protein